MPALATTAARQEALDALKDGFYAVSSAPKQRTMEKFVNRALSKWGLAPLPPTTEKLLSLGATLKAGNYRSADDYLVFYRKMCARANVPYDSALLCLHLDVLR